MDWTVSLALLFGALVAGLLTGLPVAFVFIGVNIVGLYVFLGGEVALSLLAGSAFSSIALFALVPIPLFLLMGEFLLRSGLASTAIDSADHWVGKVPGRLAVTAVGGGTLFGALSGASMASVALLSTVLAPEMQKRGYKPPFVIAPILGAGGLAVLIPPSALGVLLGAIAKISIGQLLIACIVPALILATLYVTYFVARARLQPQLAPSYPGSMPSIIVRIRALVNLVPLVGIMVIVTGFIFMGIATPSETAALGAVATFALIVTYRRFSLSALSSSVMSAASTSSMVLMILVGSTAYSQLLAATGATSGLIQAVAEAELSPLATILIMQVVVFILGCFIDPISIMLLTVPIFFPVVASMGIDPLWFAVIFLVQLELATITPPFGFLLFVMKGVRPEFPMAQIYKSVGPIVLIKFLLIAMLLMFPGLVTTLPNVMR